MRALSPAERAIRVIKKPLSEGEKFFDTWSPEMAWCLGVIYERGAAGPSMGTVVDCADLPLLKAFRELVEESKLYRTRKGVIIESSHIGERLLQLGMESGAFHVRRIPPIPEEYIRYLIRGILDTHEFIACFGSYLAEISMEFPSYQEACRRLMHRELKKRGYHVEWEPKEIDFLGISKREPATYVMSLKLSRPEDIIDCYNWLFGESETKIPFNRAQRWIWSQLHWMLRDLDACSKMLGDKEMTSELREVIRQGKTANLMGDWRE